MSLRSSSHPIYISNAIVSGRKSNRSNPLGNAAGNIDKSVCRESNPSRRICNVPAVLLGHVAVNADKSVHGPYTELHGFCFSIGLFFHG